MTWRRKLRRGSFRGASFQIDSHNATIGGRRAQTHEYPGRDTPYTEDLGRAAHEYSVQAHVVGDNYHRDRDRLRRACNIAGPGLLVHPYLGRRLVVCTQLRIRESTRQGRMATLDLTFVEAGAATLPLSLLNPEALIAAAISEAQAAISAAFTEVFSV